MSNISILSNIPTLTGDPTGFAQPDDVIVTANGDRTVTLTGTVNAYYQSVKLSSIVTGYVSPAHGSDTAKSYFLTYNGTDIAWRDLSVTPLDFTNLLISYAFYDSGNAAWIYFKETHGLMSWQTHRAEHLTIGTYKKSGGALTGYVPSSTVAAERRPDVAQVVIQDEDVATTLPAITSETYTQGTNTGTGAFTWTLAAAEIVPVNVNNPYYNSFSTPNWGQTLMPANSAATVWLVAFPAAADATSQARRLVWIQPQWITQATAASAGALTTARRAEEARQPSELNLTTLTNLAPEYIAIARITIQFTGGNWTVENVIALTGSRYSQVGAPAGNFLQSVAVNSTYFTGTGTGGDPLSFVPSSVSSLSPVTDTVIATYKDTSTITVKAGGQYTVSGVLYTIGADFDLSISADLTTDDTLTALTWYHVITNGTTWKFSDAITCSDVTGGVALNIGVSIWNSSGLKVRQFTYDGSWYRYAHDAILLYSATMPTVNQTIALAAYVPTQVRRVELRTWSGLFTYAAVSPVQGAGVYINDTLASAATWFFNSSIGYFPHQIPGVFQASVGRSFSLRCDLAYPGGKLYLQAWSV